MVRAAVWIGSPCLPGKFQFLELLFMDLFGAVGTDRSVGSAGTGFWNDNICIAALRAKCGHAFQIDLVEEVSWHCAG